MSLAFVREAVGGRGTDGRYVLGDQRGARVSVMATEKKRASVDINIEGSGSIKRNENSRRVEIAGSKTLDYVQHEEKIK